MITRKPVYVLLLILYIFLIVVRMGFPYLLASEISSVGLVELANRERIKKDIPPLKYNKKLEKAAYDKADDMFKKQYWAHFGPNKESPWQFITGAGYNYTYAGENLAKGFFEAETVHQAWMNSPTHRENIMDPSFDEVGIAVVKGNMQGTDVFLVVQMFGSTEFKTASQRNTDYPKLLLSYPKEGDILDEGIFTVRGEINKLKDNQVTLLLNSEFLKNVTSPNQYFEYDMPAAPSRGDLTLAARAVGQGDEYLFDTVNFKVVNSKGDFVPDLKECISIVDQPLQLLASYTCESKQKITAFTIQIESAKFEHDKDTVQLITIPKSALPDNAQTGAVTLDFTDGKSNYFKVPLPASVQNQSKTQLTSGTLAVSNVRYIFWIGIGIIILLIGIGIFVAVRRHELNKHKFEIMIAVFGVIMLILILQLGIIHV